MSSPKKISITVVVNGQPTVVDAAQDAALGTIIPDALRQTENTGQPAENWELSLIDRQSVNRTRRTRNNERSKETPLLASILPQ